MSRKGNPYDNAFAESFIKTLKYETVYLNEHNKKRLHSSLGYKSPEVFEMEVNINKLV
jgi:putative transposase